MDDFYKRVLDEQLQHLKQFRGNHTPEHLGVGGLEWEYSVSGKGTETLVLLPGGFVMLLGVLAMTA